MDLVIRHFVNWPCNIWVWIVHNEVSPNFLPTEQSDCWSAVSSLRQTRRIAEDQPCVLICGPVKKKRERDIEWFSLSLSLSLRSLTDENNAHKLKQRYTRVYTLDPLTDSIAFSKRNISSCNKWRVPVLPRWRANAAAQAECILFTQFSSSTWHGA